MDFLPEIHTIGNIYYKIQLVNKRSYTKYLYFHALVVHCTYFTLLQVIDSDYKTLVKAGNIGYYDSCEITQFFLLRKSDEQIINFFMIGVFEEQPFTNRNHSYLGKPIDINKDYKLGIQRYYLSVDEATQNIETLAISNKWDYDGDLSLQIATLRQLSKQYIPGKEDHTVNKILKNNFHSGSYLIEFFDEKKNQL